jgi:hypothetical protein
VAPRTVYWGLHHDEDPCGSFIWSYSRKLVFCRSRLIRWVAVASRARRRHCAMRSYRCYFLSGANRIKGVEEFKCANDESAVPVNSRALRLHAAVSLLL